jgi:hypothetical protein
MVTYGHLSLELKLKPPRQSHISAHNKKWKDAFEIVLPGVFSAWGLGAT